MPNRSEMPINAAVKNTEILKNTPMISTITTKISTRWIKSEIDILLIVGISGSGDRSTISAPSTEMFRAIVKLSIRAEASIAAAMTQGPFFTLVRKGMSMVKAIISPKGNI
ncbi:hypothetical protein D3C75_930050 [compost metagenome]